MSPMEYIQIKEIYRSCFGRKKKKGGEHKRREEDRFSASLGQRSEWWYQHGPAQSVQSVQSEMGLCCSSIKLKHSFINTVAVWKSTKSYLDFPHNPADWLPIHFTEFFCWPLIMISRTLVRSIILVSISMMSGWSLAPLMNSSNVSSPEDRK